MPLIDAGKQYTVPVKVSGRELIELLNDIEWRHRIFDENAMPAFMKVCGADRWLEMAQRIIAGAIDQENP